jgi:hypothetical protein
MPNACPNVINKQGNFNALKQNLPEPAVLLQQNPASHPTAFF